MIKNLWHIGFKAEYIVFKCVCNKKRELHFSFVTPSLLGWAILDSN